MMRPKDLRQGSGTRTFLDAMHGGKVHLARFVLDALDGRIINSKTEQSRTPLMFAACLPDLGTRAKFTRLLLEKGADVNCRDESGRTALSHACEAGHLDAVKLLVQFNADPDVSDAWGNSALMYAAFSGHGPVLDFLVRAFKRLGLRLDRANSAGHTALDVANFFGHGQCVQILSSSCRRGPLGSAGEGEGRRPLLERCPQRPGGPEEPLPAVGTHRRPVGGDGAGGLWSRFRCPRSQSQEEGGPRGWAPPPPAEKSPAGEGGQGAPSRSQREAGPEGKPAVSLPAWGRAKSLNLEPAGGRKQSDPGDPGELQRAASSWKRASLQDERCLLDQTQRRADQSGPPAGKIQAGRTPEEGGAGSQRHRVGEAAPPSVQKRGSLVRQGKLLPPMGEREGEGEGGRAPGRSPGLRALGTRLLRRFTAPEFMRMVKECSPGSAAGRGHMARSETFPLSQAQRHLVDSQPSVDSISGVRCEFESCSSRSARQ